MRDTSFAFPESRGSAPASRRVFLASATLAACGAARAFASEKPEAPPVTNPFDFPLVDYHVHLDNSTIDAVLELARERGVKFGIVEHAGTRENVYPVVLSNDDELNRYADMLEGKPVFKGVQAEWTDWHACFSKKTLARLDYVLTDTMTFPGPDGRRMKMWEAGADMGDPNTFMDRYVDWYVDIVTKQPIDLLANVSWLPDPFMERYDELWTEARMDRVLEAAKQYNAAIEISSGFRLPKRPFLQRAKAAGLRFAFGSNGRYPKMGKLDYSIEWGQALGLRAPDMFTPPAEGPRAAR